MPRSLQVIVSSALILCLTMTARSEDEPSKKVDDSPKKAESAIIKEAREHMTLLSAKSSGDGTEAEVELLSNPALSYGDAARNWEGGTLWVWGKSGRPAAFMELFRDVGTNQPWIHALTLTSPELIQLTGPIGKRWTPKKSHFELKDVPDSPEVSDRPVVRLRQMKEISRRIEAHEFWEPNNSRFELRLLVQPVHRYQDESAKVIDGTVFVLAHGTNPEVIVQIEAHASEPPRWQYSFVRLAGGELHVSFDNKEVWTAPRNVTDQSVDPYWLFWSPPTQPAAK